MKAEQTRRLAREAGLRADDVAAVSGIDARAAQEWINGAKHLGRVKMLRVRQEAWRRRRMELLARAGLPEWCPEVRQLAGDAWVEHRQSCPTCEAILEACEPIGPAPSGDVWSNAIAAVMRSPLGRVPVVGRVLRFVLFSVSLAPFLLQPVLGGGRRDAGPAAGVGCSMLLGVLASAVAVLLTAAASLGPWGPLVGHPGGIFAATASAVAVLGLGARTLGRSHLRIVFSSVVAALTGTVAYVSVGSGMFAVPAATAGAVVAALVGTAVLAILGISAVEGRVALELAIPPKAEGTRGPGNGT